MNAAEWIGVVGAAAWAPGIWGVWEAIRKRRTSAARSIDEGDRMVVQSAMDLLLPYRQRVDELEKKLRETESTVQLMSSELSSARRQVSDLNEQLGDAQAEVRLLRGQVKSLLSQLPPEQS